MAGRLSSGLDRVLRRPAPLDAQMLARRQARTNKLLKSINASLRELGRLPAIVEELRRQIEAVDRVAQANNLLLKSQRDNIDELRRQLWAVRQLPEYGAALDNPDPLISVRIASYNKTEELLDVAVRSVLEQTYQRFELIVVNDGPNDRTRSGLEGLDDERIRYVELPRRSRYPADSHQRWMVAGSPGMNFGAHLARGDWIAPLDDDDAFTPDHLEKLLAAALSTRSEMAYGALIQRQALTGEDLHVWSDPPERGAFSFQAAIYLRVLSFFEYDQESWLVKEPGDWNLCRRMQLAGVSMTAIEDVVGTMHMVPYDGKDE
jgi:hypothetical protein